MYRFWGLFYFKITYCLLEILFSWIQFSVSLENAVFEMLKYWIVFCNWMFIMTYLQKTLIDTDFLSESKYWSHLIENKWLTWLAALRLLMHRTATATNTNAITARHTGSTMYRISLGWSEKAKHTRIVRNCFNF